MPELECMKTLAGRMPPETPVIIVLTDSKWWHTMKAFTRFLWNFRVPRNYDHHKKFFALIDLVLANTDDRFLNVDHARKTLTVLAGWTHSFYDTDGVLHVVPMSIKFSEMDQAKFDKYYSDIIDAILKYVMPGLDKRDIEEQIVMF